MSNKSSFDKTTFNKHCSFLLQSKDDAIRIEALDYVYDLFLKQHVNLFETLIRKEIPSALAQIIEMSKNLVN